MRSLFQRQLLDDLQGGCYLSSFTPAIFGKAVLTSLQRLYDWSMRSAAALASELAVMRAVLKANTTSPLFMMVVFMAATPRASALHPNQRDSVIRRNVLSRRT